MSESNLEQSMNGSLLSDVTDKEFEANSADEVSFRFTVDEEDKILEEDFDDFTNENDDHESESKDYERHSISNYEKNQSPKKSTNDKRDPNDDEKLHKKLTEKKKTSEQNESSLWVSGLSSATRAQELKLLFSKYAKVISAKIVTNTKNPDGKCYGYITVSSREDADVCIDKLTKTEVRGKLIQVEIAKAEPGGGAKSAHKNEKTNHTEEERRRHRSRSPAFIGPKERPQRNGSRERSPFIGPLERPQRRDYNDRRPNRRGSWRDSQSRGNSHDFSAKFRRNRHTRSPEREVLTFSHIARERDDQRRRNEERIYREKEKLRREEYLRRIEEKEQMEEYDKMFRERERLRYEREKIERQKRELLMLQREQEKYKRERERKEREELHPHKSSKSDRYYSKRESSREKEKDLHKKRREEINEYKHERTTKRYPKEPSYPRDPIPKHHSSHEQYRSHHPEEYHSKGYNEERKEHYNPTSNEKYKKEYTSSSVRDSSWNSPSASNTKEKRGRKRYLVQLGQ